MNPANGNQHFHLEIWRDIMEQIHKQLDLPTKNFDVPSNVVMVPICQDSGKIATDLCYDDPRGNRVVETPFAAGTAPTEFCDLHGAVTIDTSTGMKATPYCPSDLLKTYYGIIVKDEDLTDPSYQIPESLYNAPYCTVHTAPSVDEPTDTPLDSGTESPDQQDTADQTAPPDQTSLSDQTVFSDQTAPPDQTAAAEEPAVTEQPQVSEQPAATEQPAIPPEFQNTAELPPANTDTQQQPPADQGTPPRSQSAADAPPDSSWVEPSANPSPDAVQHIDNQNNPVVDEPTTLDNFVP